jgi:hypothetical protein
MSQYSQAISHALEMLGPRNIEDQEVVQARRRTRAAVAVMCELQVVGTSWKAEHHAIVTVVVSETIEFRKAKAIPIKANYLLQAICRPRDTHLGDEDLICEFQRRDVGRYGWLSCHVFSLFQAAASGIH